MRKIPFLNSMKIKQKIYLLFLGILLVYIGAFFAVYTGVFREQIYTYATNNSQSTIISIGKNLSTEIEKINTYSRILLSNESIKEYLTGNPADKMSGYQNAVRAISEVQSAYPKAYSTFVFRNDGSYFSIGGSVVKVNRQLLFSEKEMRCIKEKAGGFVLQMNGNGSFHAANGERLITLIRIINDIDTLKPIGVLAVNFPVSVLRETYSEFEGDQKRYSYYESDYNRICGKVKYDDIFFMRNQVLENSELIGEGKLWCERDNQNIFCHYQVPKTPFILASVEEVYLWNNVSGEIVRATAFLIGITCLSILIIGLFITFTITNPIQKLVKSMAGVKEGWLRRVSFDHCNDEIGMLKDSYNEMLVETNQLIEQLLDKEDSIKKAELDILQEQIKPHFLYNTLEMIAGLSLDGSREEVYGALETLGSFYRKFLSKGSSEVPMKIEIAIVQDYLKLEKLRYGDFFDDIYEIDEACESVLVPKLLLQPLVENSLYHGIRLKGERGIIKLTVKREQQDMIIEVYDNGVGMSADQMNNILDNGKTFGLKKTLERFQYFTGNKGTYHLESIESEFSRITFIWKGVFREAMGEV